MKPSRTRWTRLRRLGDRAIDYKDSPRTTPEFWAKAAVFHPARKVPVSLRLDEDVLAWFKKQGARYQTRINAVLRQYAERHDSGGTSVNEAAATYKSGLLAYLEVARERYDALENLRQMVAPRLFDYVERRIQAIRDQPLALKLPVIFFFLVRHDPRDLRRFDAFLARLRQGHRKRELPNLVDRLRSEEDYRQAVSAIFEIEILRTLLDTAPPGTVSLYPRVGRTPSHADALVRIGDKTVFIEVKLVSQEAMQERVQDLGIETAFGQPGPSLVEIRELGVHHVSRGVVAGVGDPYRDALRIMRKLREKPGQLHPDAPNVVCLGLADLFPDVTSAQWAIEAVFSGSATIPQILGERTRDSSKAETLARLVEGAKAEPRLAGILVFDVKGGRAHPMKALQNPSAGPVNRLESKQWHALTALFDFPKGSGRASLTPRKVHSN